MEKKKTGKAVEAFPVFAASLKKTYRKKLETEAHPHFDRPRRVYLRVQDAPSRGVPEAHERVAELVMIENVGEDRLDFGAEALVDMDVFLDLEVDVPERHAAKYAGTTLA